MINNRDELISRYSDYWERLTPKTIAEIKPLISDDFRFSDPFNTVQGYSAYEEMMKDMFGRIKQSKFTITAHAWSDQTEDLPDGTHTICFMKWRYNYSTKKSGPTDVIIGMSEIHINDQGKICGHFDHWDAASQFYEKFPLLGTVLRWIKSKV